MVFLSVAMSEVRAEFRWTLAAFELNAMDILKHFFIKFAIK